MWDKRKTKEGRMKEGIANSKHTTVENTEGKSATSLLMDEAVSN